MPTQVKQLDFTGEKIYIGIDVHLKSWTITILLERSRFKTLSMDPSAKTLRNYLENHFPNGSYFSAYEAGFSGYSTHRELESQGIKNIVVNPADIPTTDKERKQKEDKRDSLKIAKSLRSGELEAIYIPKISTLEFRSLVRYRKTLVKEITRCKSRIKSFLYLNGIEVPKYLNIASKHWSGKFTQWLSTLNFETEFGKSVMEQSLNVTSFLRERLLEVNRQLRGLMKSGPYAKLLQLLCTVPGVALVTAVTLLSEIENFSRFKNLDRFCSYVGLIPTSNSSGEKDLSGKITSRSNKPLRTVIIESAWIAYRNDPALAKKFTELSARMNSNQAIVRIAKKLLSRIRYIMINEKEYEMCTV